MYEKSAHSNNDNTKSRSSKVSFQTPLHFIKGHFNLDQIITEYLYKANPIIVSSPKNILKCSARVNDDH